MKHDRCGALSCGVTRSGEPSSEACRDFLFSPPGTFLNFASHAIVSTVVTVAYPFTIRERH
jgi:hypothetical protein